MIQNFDLASFPLPPSPRSPIIPRSPKTPTTPKSAPFTPPLQSYLHLPPSPSSQPSTPRIKIVDIDSISVHSDSDSDDTHPHIQTPSLVFLTRGSRSSSKIKSRPQTPLDFSSLTFRPIKRRAPLTNTLFDAFRIGTGRSEEETEERDAMDRKRSVDILGGRPDVNPDIKGIPQGWEDDLDITLPLTPSPPSMPSTKTITQDPSSPGRAISNTYQSQSQARGRLGSPFKQQPSATSGSRLKTTGIKIASWSTLVRDKAFLEVQENRRRREYENNMRLLKSQKNNGNLTPTRTHLSSPQSLPVDVPTSSIASGDTEEDFSNLFTPSTGYSPKEAINGGYEKSLSDAYGDDEAESEINAREVFDIKKIYSPSITSTRSSSSNRERVLGLKGNSDTSSMGPREVKVFKKQSTDDVLPFVGGRPFSSWDRPPSSENEVHIKRAGSRRSLDSKEKKDGSVLGGKRMNVLAEVNEGWKLLSKKGNSIGRKKIWEDEAGVYRVGWEREVMDLEARLHETMFEIAGDSHTFATYEPGAEPKAVLDVGTGLGLWPISQALKWRSARFVGLDIVPCQIDLGILAEAERKSRSTSKGTAPGSGTWESVEKRITWDQANCLKTLPYDTGVFDHVHVRFLSFAITEVYGPDFLDELFRVLSPGGTLELIDISVHLPSYLPNSLKRSYISSLLSDSNSLNPSHMINFTLPTMEGLQKSTSKPVFLGSWKGDKAPGCLSEVGEVWMKSSLEYKGTGLSPSQSPAKRRAVTEGKDDGREGREGIRQGREGMIYKVKKELGGAGRNGDSWLFKDAEVEIPETVINQESGDGNNKIAGLEDDVQVWAWLAKKKINCNR